MKKSPLFIIFLVVFIDLVGFGIVIPILPYYAKQFGASATELGWLMMCYSGMQFLFSPFWGKLSDRIGRRPVLLTCILGIGAGMLVLGLAHSLVWLFAGRILSGFFGANISAASAYIADVTPPEKRAKGMGIIGAAFGLGFLFGPALGGVLSKWGYGTAALFAATLSGLNFLFAVIRLKEPILSAEERASHRSHTRFEFLRQVLARPETGLAVILFFLVTFGMAQLETSFGLFLLARFNLDALHAGLLLALMALVMAGIQGGSIGKLVHAFGEKKLVGMGAFLMCMALIGSALSLKLGLFTFFLLIHAVGYALTNPSLSGLASRHAMAGTQGATMGVYQSAGSLGRVLGPPLAGFLFDHVGITSPFFLASFLFGGAFFSVLLSRSIWMQGKAGERP